MNNCKSHPNKNLEKHIEEISFAFNKLVEFYGIKLSEEFRDLFENLIKFHDIGKCRKKFQEYIEELEKGNSAKSPGSHTLWSLEELRNVTIWNLKKEYLPLLYFLIAKHHSNLTLNFDDEIAKILKELILKHYYKLNTLEELKTLYESFKLPREDVLEILKFYTNPPREALRLFFKNYLKRLNKDTLFDIADLFGLFKISDSLSAQNSLKDLDKLIKIEKIDEERIRSLISKDIDEKRWIMQNSIANYNYLILRAPTGWGKTTVSLLFAKNKDYRKIFLTLPTITAIEKFYKKLKEKFDAEMYFYFYDAYIFLEDEDEIDEKIKTLYYVKNLYSPINITTIDQIFLSFLQTGKYFLKRLNLRKSVLILDEAHLLTPQMIFLLKKMLKYLVPKYDMKVLLMSATIPRGLVEYLLEDIKFESIDIYGLWDKNYFDERYYNRERIEFEVIEKDILEDLDKIIEENKKGKSVLVIVNTVEKAVAVYKKLKDEYRIKNMLLLHSRFMFRDRKEKEEMIDTIEKLKGIFISTQVSEVSLDIDFDVLFTELAPISSLIQRAGRVNRYGTKEKTKVYVYYPSELNKISEDKRLKYPYEIEEILKSAEILKELKIYKEGEIIKLIDEILNKEFYEKLMRKKIFKYDIVEIFKDFFEEEESDFNLFWFLSLTSNEQEAKGLLELRENLTTLIIPGESLVEESLLEDINNLINEYKKLKESNAKYEDWEKFFAKAKTYSVPVPIWVVSGIARNDVKECTFPIIKKLKEGYNFKYFRELGFVNLDKLLEYGINIQTDHSL